MDKKASILVVEDETETAKSLVDHLKMENHDVSLAVDGEEALSLLNRNTYDIVILDLKLPKVGGFVILKHIKSNTPNTKVIVLTAYSDLKNTEICKKLGADHILGKPFDFEMLFWTIKMFQS